MCEGVRPIIRFASTPTARARLSRVLMAPTDGSLSTMPWPRTYTRVFAVPRSIAMSRVASDARLLTMVESPLGWRRVYPRPASISRSEIAVGTRGFDPITPGDPPRALAPGRCSVEEERDLARRTLG